METVYYNQEAVGEIEWEHSGKTVQATVSCDVQSDQFLRCWALTDRGWFLVGLLAPEQGKLTLSRTLSPETVKQMGAAQDMPQRFELSQAKPEGSVQTYVAQSEQEMEPRVAASDVKRRTAQRPLPTPPQTQPQEQVQDVGDDTQAVTQEPLRLVPDISEVIDIEAVKIDSRFGETQDRNCRRPIEFVPASDGGSIRQARIELQNESNDIQSMKSAPVLDMETSTDASKSNAAEVAPAVETERTTHIITGDALLDALLGDTGSGIAYEESDTEFTITCPCLPQEPFPLAYMFALCEVQDGKAILKWKKPRL